MAEKALTAQGLPYVWEAATPTAPPAAGSTPRGLTQWATAQATGENIPRTTYDQIKLGTRINPADAQPGDLVFSRFSSRGPEHVQIALGGGQVVHAPQRGDVVRIEAMPTDAVVKRIF